MKKLYLDPDFEIVNVRLVADVLKSSSDVEDPFGPGIDGGDGDDFEEGGFEVLP